MYASPVKYPVACPAEGWITLQGNFKTHQGKTLGLFRHVTMLSYYHLVILLSYHP